jgi:uncharacterized protein with gpF-like domain
MAEPERGFETPPEVLDYFRQKSLRPAFSWLEVWGEEHAHDFTVAKVIETELLDAFQKTMAESQRNGEGLETWKKKLAPELKRLGWWGPRMISDPAGIDADQVVDFSSPRRLKTIFDSNMRSARAAGQWQRIQRGKRGLPFILYVRTVSMEPRAEHVVWVGTLLPVDDLFWRTHFPPNGWGCKCSVRSITRSEARRLGYDPKAGRPQILTRTFVNRRTGEISEVPEGIDPGWQTNPGLARARTLTDNLSRKLEEAGTEIANRQVSSFWDSPERMVLTLLPEKGLSLPAGKRPELARQLGAKGEMVSAFADSARAKLGKDREQATRKAAYDRLPTIIGEGRIIDEGREDARTLVWFDGERWWSAVVQKARTGFLRIVTFHQLTKRQARKMLGE